MKLAIGENIRNFRKRNDLTQEELAERLGVTYQSISRWENGTTYPDLELLPAISEVLVVTIDELLGMPQIEKEKRAEQAFNELRRECMKRDYDADKIVTLLRDMRRNYLNCNCAYRPWSEGNGRAFRDPKVLPEVRLLAEAYLERHPMDPHTIQTMAEIEDEENIEHFIKKHTTAFDCSARTLLYRRYLHRGDAERFEPERRYQLYHAFNKLLCPRYLLTWGADRNSADMFMEEMLALIRADAVNHQPDMWVADRLELGLKSAEKSLSAGKENEAIEKIETAVKLLEDTMKITGTVLLPTSCKFLKGMEWYAEESWHNPHNDPDRPEERIIYIYTSMNGMTTCTCVWPRDQLKALHEKAFEPLHNHPEFQKLCERVKALVITKPKENCPIV